MRGSAQLLDGAEERLCVMNIRSRQRVSSLRAKTWPASGIMTAEVPVSAAILDTVKDKISAE